MSTYDREIESRVRRNSLFALGIIKQLEKDYNMKIDDNHKAHLIGQLSVAASLESLTVYANKVSKSFAFEFFQEMIKKGVVAALTPAPMEAPKEPEIIKAPEPILTEKETIVAPLIEDQSPPEIEKPELPEEESKSATEELTPSEPKSTTTTDKPKKTKVASKPSKRKKKTKKASTPKTQPK